MKRKEILSRLGYCVPKNKQVRIIIHSDVKNEADDQYAIMHHLMTPLFDVRGIIAAHFEGRYIEGKRQAEQARAMALKNPSMLKVMLERMGMDGSILNHLLGRTDLLMEDLPVPLQSMLTRKNSFLEGEGTSMEQSFQELQVLMERCSIDDIPLCHGCTAPLQSQTDAPGSEGVRLIIEEALHQDERPLYILLQGCLTDLASALNTAPEIAGRMTAIWIGGGAYPDGGMEFNLMQDLYAARIIFASQIPLWQIPVSTYSQVEISFADLAMKVRPCGAVGAYLFDELLEVNQMLSQYPGTARRGENWCLGDQPAAAVLLQSGERKHYHEQPAPLLGDDYSYIANPGGRSIRIYDQIDTRMLLDDFFAKLWLCYGPTES